MGTARTGTADERRLYLPIGAGAALMLGPMAIYPGNWSEVAPLTSADQTAWAVLGLLVVVSIAIGGGLLGVSGVRLIRGWRARPEGMRRRDLADTLARPRGRRLLLASGTAYVLLVGAFLSLYGWSSGGPGE